MLKNGFVRRPDIDPDEFEVRIGESEQDDRSALEDAKLEDVLRWARFEHLVIEPEEPRFLQDDDFITGRLVEMIIRGHVAEFQARCLEFLTAFAHDDLRNAAHVTVSASVATLAPLT